MLIIIPTIIIGLIVAAIVSRQTTEARAQRAIRDFMARCEAHAKTIDDPKERGRYLRYAHYMEETHFGGCPVADIPHRLACTNPATFDLNFPKSGTVETF